MKMDHEQPHIVAAEKPRWFKSPLASDRLRRASEAQPHESPFKDDDHANYDGYPPFKRYDEPTLLEIFYDLFFAANYNVFAQSQSVTDRHRFKAYVGYFSLIWGTWFLVTLYDVRYVTDSIFERVARAVQLGVLVGFTVVAPNFDPGDQDQATMMTMSLMLFASRVCLAIEYAHTLAQIFKYKRARRPLYLQIAINVISAAVYLGITFRFQNKQSRVFITWYLFTAGEAILSLIMSNYWKTLSFTRTHLMKRLSLITVMILGEGVQTVAQNIATIVMTPAAWNALTIGMITAATATLYCVFLVYFDWMRHLHLPALRQQIWTALHYPFHLALVVFMQGFTQLILFVKAVNVLDSITGAWLSPIDTENGVDNIANETSSNLAKVILDGANEIFNLYPPKDSAVRAIVNDSIANISTIPDKTWPDLENYLTSNDTNVELNNATLTGFATLVERVAIIASAMANSVFTSFNIDLSTDVSLKHPDDNNPLKLADNQITISEKTSQRGRLVFACTYISCGCTLILLVFMALVSRLAPLGRLPRFRFIVCTLLGITMALTSILYFAPQRVDALLDGPWAIPAILFAWLVVTVLVHIRGTNTGRGPGRSPRDTARRVVGLFRPRRKNREDDTPRDDAESQQVVLRFWPPTRENTSLSAAETLQSAGEAASRTRRVSFRDVSPKAVPRSRSPVPELRDEDDHRKADAHSLV